MEATNAADELFGEMRTLETLNRAQDADPQALLECVDAEVKRFVGDAPQFDDLTMLCLQYNGPSGSAEQTSPAAPQR